MFDKKLFGTNIRNYRKELGLSIYEFSIMIDVNYTHLTNIELGRRIPTARVVVSILNGLNMTYDECINNTDFNTREFYKNIINSSLNLFKSKELDFILDVAKSFNLNSGEK